MRGKEQNDGKYVEYRYRAQAGSGFVHIYGLPLFPSFSSFGNAYNEKSDQR